MLLKYASIISVIFSIVLIQIPSHKTAIQDKGMSDPVATVGMTNTMTFTPDTVKIEAGETVKWVNSSMLAHSVTGDPEHSTVEGSAELPKGANAFDSGMLDPDETFTHTFEKPGTYQYFCIPHEGAKMYGWVIVL